MNGRDSFCTYAQKLFFFYFLGKDYNPCFTKQYTTGYLQYLCTSLSGLTVLFVAVLPSSYDCVNVEVVIKSGRALIDLAACGRWF